VLCAPPLTPNNRPAPLSPFPSNTPGPLAALPAALPAAALLAAAAVAPVTLAALLVVALVVVAVPAARARACVQRLVAFTSGRPGGHNWCHETRAPGG
jgi:hypothetical protein